MRGAARLVAGADLFGADTAPCQRAAELRARWRDLVAIRLPRAARGRPDWPVRHDHCFARILLDNACGAPWRERVAAPAWANMPPDRLAAAIDLGEAVLRGGADLALLDRRSLRLRRTARPPTASDLLGAGRASGASA